MGVERRRETAIGGYHDDEAGIGRLNSGHGSGYGREVGKSPH